MRLRPSQQQQHADYWAARVGLPPAVIDRGSSGRRLPLADRQRRLADLRARAAATDNGVCLLFTDDRSWPTVAESEAKVFSVALPQAADIADRVGTYTTARLLAVLDGCGLPAATTAEMLRTSPTAVNAWQNGRSNPRTINRQRLVYAVTVCELAHQQHPNLSKWLQSGDPPAWQLIRDQQYRQAISLPPPS